MTTQTPKRSRKSQPAVPVHDAGPAKSRVQQSAEQRMRWLATVVADSNDAVVLFDVTGSILVWNRGAQATYGWTEEEALRMNIRDIAPADRSDEISDVIRRLQGGDDVASFETKRRTKGGRVLDMWLTAAAVRDETGQVEAIATTERDITERKRAEADMVRAKDEWERTFDCVPDLIAILDDQHRVVRTNRAMAERLNATSERCAGVACYKVVHGTDAPPDFCPHAQTLKDGRGHAAEVHEDRLGGDFLVTTTPMFGPDGKMIGSVHVARDITERKRAEAELRRRAEELRLANEELTSFNRVAVGRELRMVELKKQVNELCAKAGLPKRYELEFVEETDTKP